MLLILSEEPGIRTWKSEPFYTKVISTNIKSCTISKSLPFILNSMFSGLLDILILELKRKILQASVGINWMVWELLSNYWIHILRELVSLFEREESRGNSVTFLGIIKLERETLSMRIVLFVLCWDHQWRTDIVWDRVELTFSHQSAQKVWHM